MRERVPNLELTTRQKQAWEAIKKFHDKHQALPSQRKLGELLGISGNAAYNLIVQLTQKGWLEEKPVTQIRLTLGSKGLKKGAA